MVKNSNSFDELLFFAKVKKSPGFYFGKPSLISFRDFLFGMVHAFSFCFNESQFNYFYSFTQWYEKEYIKDIDTYACWWNHLLYTNGNDDKLAFNMFFKYFEEYLHQVHNITLPNVDGINS